MRSVWHLVGSWYYSRGRDSSASHIIIYWAVRSRQDPGKGRLFGNGKIDSFLFEVFFWNMNKN